MKIKNKILLLQSLLLLIIFIFFLLIFILVFSRAKNVINMSAIALNLNIDISRYKDFERHFENSVVHFNFNNIKDFRTSLVKGLYEIQLFEQSITRSDYDDYPVAEDLFEIRTFTKNIKDSYYNIEKLFILQGRDEIDLQELKEALRFEIEKINLAAKNLQIKMNAFFATSKRNMNQYIIEIDNIAKKAFLYIVLLMVLFFCLILLFTYGFTSSITKPLLNLVNVMKYVEKEDYERPVIMPKTNDEVSYLTNAFKNMIKTLKARDAELKINNQNLVYQRNVVEITNQKLEELNKIKSEYLANMGHELKTPLNSILGYADLIKEDWYDKFNDESREDLNLLIQQAKSLYDIIILIMEISKLESGKVPVYIDYFNIDELVKGCYNTLLKDITDKGLIFKYTISPKLNNVKSDAEKIRRIILNLLTNSVKFTDKGRIKIFIKQANKLDYKKYILNQDKKYLKIIVYDTGMGIPEKDKFKVFDEFYQAHAGKKESGSGLGLAIVKKLVNLLKGQIIIKSIENEYTAVYVFLEYRV